MTNQQQNQQQNQQEPQHRGNQATQANQARQGSVRGAVATREAAPVSVQTTRRYLPTFAEMLPEHVPAKAFVGAAIGALKKDPDLLAAAERSPDHLVVALMQCATLGHTPGGKEFYLTRRFDKAVGGEVIAGMEGYQGVIERMYRSGAVKAVIVREVCHGDAFRFVEGQMDKPEHDVDWFADDDRDSPERIVGVYAYAVLEGGATSKVVVLNRHDVEKARQKSDLGKKGKGPWVSDYRAMVLKTGAHRLEPWVPTAVDERRDQLRARAAAGDSDETLRVDPATGEVMEAAAG